MKCSQSTPSATLKRVVSSLLMQVDELPSYIAVGAAASKAHSDTSGFMLASLLRRGALAAASQLDVTACHSSAPDPMRPSANR